MKSAFTSHKVLAVSPHLSLGQALPGQSSGQQKVICFVMHLKKQENHRALMSIFNCFFLSEENMFSGVCHLKRKDESPNDLGTAGLPFHLRRQSCGEAPGCQEETFPTGRLPDKRGSILSGSWRGKHGQGSFPWGQDTVHELEVFHVTKRTAEASVLLVG